MDMALCSPAIEWVDLPVRLNIYKLFRCDLTNSCYFKHCNKLTLIMQNPGAKSIHQTTVFSRLARDSL